MKMINDSLNIPRVEKYFMSTTSCLVDEEWEKLKKRLWPYAVNLNKLTRKTGGEDEINKTRI